MPMESFTTEAAYLAALETRAALPEGFRVATAPLTFRPAEREVPRPLPMNLSLILLEHETAEFAAVYTANRFPGAPVAIGRERLGGAAIRGVLVNNKIANVCTPTGRADAERLCAALGRETGSPAEAFLPASTGIIGWRLPVAEMEAAIPGLVRGAAGRLDRARGEGHHDHRPVPEGPVRAGRRRPHRRHRQGRGHDRAPHGHAAVLPADGRQGRPRRAARRAALGGRAAR